MIQIKIQVKDPLQNDNRVQCPKCLRKFASDRLQKHVTSCKSVPSLANLESKSKITPKIEVNAVKEKPMLKPIVQTPKTEEKLVKIIGQDQYVKNQLQQCLRCSRKFVPQRLQKHMQICKGSSSKPKHEKPSQSTKPSTMQPQPKQKLNQQQLRKTKNEFMTMVKDLKHKKIREEEIEQELDTQLQQIQKTTKMSHKQRQNSQRKKKQVLPNVNKSINLPKI